MPENQNEEFVCCKELAMRTSESAFQLHIIIISAVQHTVLLSPQYHHNCQGILVIARGYSLELGQEPAHEKKIFPVLLLFVHQKDTRQNSAA